MMKIHPVLENGNHRGSIRARVVWMSLSIRKGMLKLVRHLLKPSTKTESYNLAEVVSKSTNIAFNAAPYKTVKRQMQSTLKMTGLSPRQILSY